jgi:hypothetical protein
MTLLLAFVLLSTPFFARRFVGQAILPAAAFQAAFSDHVRVFATGESRLKAGCSQDWLPHSLASVAR